MIINRVAYGSKLRRREFLLMLVCAFGRINEEQFPRHYMTKHRRGVGSEGGKGVWQIFSRNYISFHITISNDCLGVISCNTSY